MSEGHLICPHCLKHIDYGTIMGDSDWDDQGYEPYETECPLCDKYIKVTQIDIQISRFFEVNILEE